LRPDGDEAVAEIVRQQIACGIDIVNDGELSKFNFTDYVRGRIAGYEARPNANISSSVNTIPSSAKLSMKMRFEMTSLSTSTPSQSKITRSGWPFIGEADPSQEPPERS
jgi:hypothetical protein